MIKNILSSCILAVVLYAFLGGYIVALFNGKLPGMKNNEPSRICTTHDREDFNQQTFEYAECGK